MFVEGAEFPEQVFRHSDNLAFLLTDNGLLTAASLWDVVQDISARYGDETVSFHVVDSHASQGAVQQTLPDLRANTSGDGVQLRQWLDLAPSESGPIYIIARTVAISGSSERWGIWIDQDQEIAILGV